MRRLLIALVLLVPTLCFAVLEYQDWPQRGFDSQKRGAIDYELGFVFQGTRPITTKASIEGLAVLGNDVIVNLGNKTVLSVSDKGKLNWATTIETRAYGVPAIHSKDIFLACLNGNIIRLDGQTGKIKWNSKIADLLTTEITIYGRLGFIGTKSGLICIDISNGSQTWIKNLPSQIQTPTVSSGFVVVNYENGISCFQISNGAKVWEINSTSALIGCAVIDEDRLYIGNSDSFLKCLSLWNGQELWKVKRDYTAAIPTISKDRLYFPGKGTVTCLSKYNGKTIWTQILCQEVIWAQIVKSGAYLIVGGTDNNAYIINARDGELNTKLPIASSVSVQMAVGNGFVAIPDLKQRLFIYIKNSKILPQAH